MMHPDLHKYLRYAFVGIPLVIFIVLRMTGFNGLYGQDSFEYLRYTNALGLYLREGTLPGPYPWPPVYPMLGALAGLVIPETLALQLISIASFAISILLMERIITFHFFGLPRETRVFTLLFFALSPFVVRYSVTVMSDALAMCFALASYLHYVKYIWSKKARHFFLLLVFFFLAVNTRFSAAIILVVPVVVAGITFITHFSTRWFLLALAGGVVIFSPNFLLGLTDPGALEHQYQAMTWDPMHLFSFSFSNIDGVSSYPLPNILFVTEVFFHPGFIFTGPLFFILLLMKPRVLKPLLPIFGSLLLYSLFTAGFPLQNARYLLFSFPVVLMLYFWPVMSALPRNDGRIARWVMPLLLVAFLLQVMLIVRAIRPFHENCLVTREVAEEVGRYPGRLVYEFNMAMAFPAYGISNPSKNLWSSRIERFEPGSLLVFNLEETQVRWEGLNPMLNWYTLERNYNLRLIRSFDKGWKLYAIDE